ncbi:hypothetical protein [Lachnospira multipara]|uniref:hypothetical protein n=1 Tax=Lachnospira multipara TaxID=28051 RepID=UPI0012DF26C3|nr:hypothetical protein [Lachnospira multipara]
MDEYSEAGEEYELSRQWLDEHGLERVKQFCLNKYGRDAFYQAGKHNLELEDFYQMQFAMSKKLWI